jgi:hypothetical protein
MMEPRPAAQVPAGTLVPGLETPGVLARLWRLVGDEALLVVSTATFAAALVWRLSGQVNQDAWLALVGGREIMRHGLPHHEALTLWGHGHAWIDQQWLAQLTLYSLYTLGGLAFLAVAHALLTTAAYSAAVAGGRRLGGSSRSVLFFLPVCFWLLIGSTWQVRTQTLAYLPFVALVWLLAVDARRPSRRVYLALPLVALWANLHGSVVLAAALVVLRGVAYALGPGRSRMRAGLLIVFAPTLLLASPYGLSLAGYYRETLFNSAFGSMLNEWQPPTWALATAPFFGLLVAVAWLAGRARGRILLFDVLALGFTGVAGLTATRNLGWFALTALMLAPNLVDASFATTPHEVDGKAARVNRSLAVIATLTVLVLLGATLARPASWFEGRYPSGAADAVARAAAGDPRARIYADVAYGDWLLWLHPELAGRIAYDARFELLTRKQILAIYDFDVPVGTPWLQAATGYRLLVLDGAVSATPVRAFERQPGTRVLFSGSNAVVLERPR